MSEALDLGAHLACARAAATAATDALRGARATQVAHKSTRRDLVTEWDLRSEAIIREVLSARAPGVPIVGEEGGGDATEGPRWLVDPIDGTVNFAHGLPEWAISIGLVDERGPAVGVVCAPRLGWTFWAARGQGAWLDDHGDVQRLAVSSTAVLVDALLATGFPYDLPTSRHDNLAEWAHFQRHAAACRRLGAASLDLCLVARGSFDGYWERTLSPWDLAAGACVVVEAGGVISDTRGQALPASPREVLASNGRLHASLVTELAHVAAARGAPP